MKNDVKYPDFSKYPNLEKFMNKKDKYILDEDNNVIPASIIEWGEFLENHRDRKIVKQETVNGFRVSTVFLGLDHGWPEMFALNTGSMENYKPQIFETMVFKGDGGLDEYCERYSTWQESEKGHQKAVEWVKNGCKDEGCENEE